MRIAVTSQNFRTVTGHAGRARRFIIFEAQADMPPAEVERLDLPKELAMHEFHGSGAHPLDGVDVILSESFGEGFAQRLAKRGILAVRTPETNPIDAVTAFLSNAAPKAAALAECHCSHGGHHRHGGHDHE
jgi:predicted Fe-Mo cluster-binding NifX family protein